MQIHKSSAPSMSENGDTLRANFKVRTGVQSVTRRGAGVSAAENYIHHFEMMPQRNGFCFNRVFNCVETGLFWKKMPRRAYTTPGGKKMPGHKPLKDG